MKDESAPDPRFDPRFQRGYDGPEPDPVPLVPSPSREPTVQTPRAPSRSPQEVDDPTDETDFVWTPPRRNRYAIALLVAALAMIAVGTWVIWQFGVTVSQGYTSNEEEAVAVLQQTLAPALLIAGVLGVIAWLALGALAASDRQERR